MKASEVKLGTEVEFEWYQQHSYKGIVISNCLPDGDEVIAVSWYEGKPLYNSPTSKINVNDVSIVEADKL